MKMNMNLLAVGDLHGRDYWKKIIPGDHDRIVFTGDYADSFDIFPEKILENLTSETVSTVKACASALTRLRPSKDPKTLFPLIQLLNRSFKESGLQPHRALILHALQIQSGRDFDLNTSSTDGVDRPEILYKPVLDWFAEAHPGAVKETMAAANVPKVDWRAQFPAIQSEKGDPARGRRWFTERACATCHDSPGALGPPLAGVSRRLSIEALLESIYEPSRTIAPAFQMTQYLLRNGNQVEGLEAFNSADGVIVQTAPGTTVRLADSEIAGREISRRSLMPDNLLESMSPADIADLLAFLVAADQRPGSPPR